MLAARAASHGRLVASQTTASAARSCRESYPIPQPCSFKCSRALSIRPKKIASRKNEIVEDLQDEREPWMTQKTALKSKFGEEGWQPRKRLSPDAIEGIRSLHAQDPEIYTTPYLANHFEVSAEAIRRILKSKWRPSPGEDLNRRERWERRGQSIWSHWAELGYDPPKKWKAGIPANDKTPTPSETNTATTRARKPKGGNGGDSSLSSRIL